MSCTATSRCWRSKPAMRYAPPLARPDTTIAKSWLPRPASNGMRWPRPTAICGLFGSRKLIDLRIPSGKPGIEGARVLEDCARHPNADTLMLITLPRLDRAATGSAWFSALEQAGVTIAVYPLERDELPQWIAARLARQKQRASADTLQFLADTTEGNLLAAQQEVQKARAAAARGRARSGGSRAGGRRRRALRRLSAFRSVACR